MPANLTPQYQKAEEEYRKAQTPDEQVECLQTMLRLIPKHKGTDKLQADLKARLKETKADVQKAKSESKKARSYRIPHQGAGQVILLGAPNSGKSRVLAELTNARPEVAAFPYTTHEPMPGMMLWEDVTVQLVDTPPITADHIEPYLTSVVRSSDAALLCLDGSSDDGPDQTADVIEQLQNRKTTLADETGFDEDDFSVVRVKTILVVTRGDDPGCADRLEYFREGVTASLETQLVEFDREESTEALRDRIYQALNVIRVYTKKPGKQPDFQDPFTIPQGGSVEDLAYKVHRDLAETFGYAKVWGTSAFDGQTVGREHRLSDKDVVELHT